MLSFFDEETLMYMLALCLIWPVGYIAEKILKGK